MTKLKKIDGLYLLIFLLPFLDGISLINTTTFLITLTLKGLFLLYSVYYLVKNTKHKKIFALLGIYFFIYLLHVFTNHLNPSFEITNLLTIFSLPTFILFFTQYQKETMTKKTITILSLLYIIVLLIFSLFGFTINNEILNLFLLLFGVALFYISDSNSYLLKGLFLIAFCLLTLFINNEIFFISILMLVLFYLFGNLRKIAKTIKKNQLKSLLLVLTLCIGLAVYIPKMDLTKDKTSLEPYSTKEIFINERIDLLKNVQKSFKESSGMEKVLGIGYEKLNSIHYVESDIFDLFYSIGILGLFFYFFYFAYVFKFSHLKKNYTIIFVFLLILSNLGNVLINPYLIPFLSLLFLISKNDNGKMKKDILFVSNMYPSKEYPHYGIFVKNTYDLLVEDNHTIDLVVMYKTNGKIKKLFSYVKLCGDSLLKAVFNNYDYIYVHFVSHTTAGVFLPALCAKNTKLVLNTHGNDIVADTNVDKGYLGLTRLFLKGSDIVISPSNYFKKVLIKNYKVAKEKIVIFPSGGVDLAKFKKIDKKKALKNANLDSKFKYFGYIARIEKDKGYDVFVKAIHEFRKINKKEDVKFLLVGSGSEEPKLKALIQKYKLQKIIIRKPLVSQEELVNIYNALDVFIYPTRMKSESLGLTGLEAMACETFVIGSNQYGPSDYLIDGENSLTFNPSDYKELANKMNVFLKLKTTEKNRLIKNARKKSEEYSSEYTKKTILDVFSY